MQTFILSLKAALLGALICVAAWTVLFLDALTRTAAALPVTIDGAIAREGALTRKAAERQIGAARKAIIGQISGLRGDVNDMQKDLTDRAEKQISNWLDQLNSQLQALTGNLDRRLGEITTPAGAAITGVYIPTQNTLSKLSDSADLALDCTSNPDCAFNRYVGTARAIEKTSVSVQKMADTIQQETPETAQAVKATSKNLSIIVQRFSKPASWISGVASQAAKWAGKFLGF